VANILRNPTYKREAYAWQWRTGRSSTGSKTPTRRPSDERVRLPDGAVPAIVSPELWQRARDNMQQQSGDHTRNERRPVLLRGTLTCAICGHRLRPSWRRRNWRTKGPERTYIYRCPSYAFVGRCGAKSIARGPVEDWVWSKVCDALRHSAVIAAELQRRQAEGPDPTLKKDLETARKNARKAEHGQERLLQKYTNATDDSFPWEMVEREVARLEGEKKRWQATVQELQGRLSDQSKAADQLAQVQEYCKRVAANLDTFTFEEKRFALETLHVHVVANGRDWHLTGAIPFDLDDSTTSTANESGYDVSDRVS
jgi:Recombinase zinc beta ribbon domain